MQLDPQMMISRSKLIAYVCIAHAGRYRSDVAIYVASAQYIDQSCKLDNHRT